MDKEADLHSLTDEEWLEGHKRLFGHGSCIPDDQLKYVWTPGESAPEVSTEDAIPPEGYNSGK